MAAALLMGGSLMAQEPQVLIEDTFEEYTVGNKIAVEAVAAGHDWWTTWSSNPGSGEDGVVADFEGTKCGYLTYGVDQVLLLGDEQSGIYDLEFDILVPNGKNAYFNILHHFAGGSSEWALECYLHMTGSNTHAPGQGSINAGGTGVATFTPVYDGWMHFRLHVDTDNDVAEYYLTNPGEEEQLVHTWQWSLDASSQNTAAHGRKLAAMDFFPPQNAANSEFYLDDFRFTKLSGESIAHLTFAPEAIESEIELDEMTTATLNISNAEGTTIGEWLGWIDFGQSEGGSATNSVNYDIDVHDNTGLIGYNITDPVLFEVGAMYPAALYASSVMGANIIQAQYYVGEASTGGNGFEPNTPLTIRVYQQGMFGQPGTVLGEKVIPAGSIVNNSWNTVTFDEPIPLTGYDVWVTAEFMHAVGGYPLVMDGQAHNPNGDYYRTQGGGQFTHVNQEGGEERGNFHIRLICQGAPVIGSWATMSKGFGSIAIGQSDEVTISLNSFGLENNTVYEANIHLVTNDPDNTEVAIPLVLKVGTVSVAETENQLATIYPNPATASITLEGTNLSSVAIYNVAGQLVRIEKLGNMINTINLDVEAGVYFFSVYDNNGNNSVQRVVVTK